MAATTPSSIRWSKPWSTSEPAKPFLAVRISLTERAERQGPGHREARKKCETTTMGHTQGTRSEVESSRYDYVIVGAGSAGCVLAARLSADPTARVRLLESVSADKIGRASCRDRGCQ